MNLHRFRLRPSKGNSRRQRWGKISSEGCLAGISLLLSLIMISTNFVNGYSVRFLVFVFFICSTGLLIIRMRDGVRLGTLSSIMFVAGFIVWYSYPAFISFFFPKSHLDHDVYFFIDEEMIVRSVAYLSLFLFTGVGVSLLLRRSKSVQAPYESLPTKTNSRMLISLALGGCSFGLMSYLFLGGSLSEVLSDILLSRTGQKPWIQTSNLGDTITPFAFIASSVMIAGNVLLWSTALLDRRVSIPARALIGTIALFITTIVYIDQGTRCIFTLVILPPIVAKLIALWNRSRLRALVSIVIVATIGIALLQFQVVYRSGFTTSNLGRLIFEDWYTLGGTIDFFKETLFAVMIVPAYHDYFRESVFVHFIVSPIPRFIWPAKPVSQLVWFYTLSRWNIDIYNEAGNTLPGIVGQYYMSWGWLGPIMIGGLLGWLTRRLDAVLSRIEIENDPYSYAFGIMVIVWLFISYRLLSPGFLYPVVGVAFIVFVSRRIGRKWQSSYSLRRPRTFLRTSELPPRQFL